MKEGDSYDDFVELFEKFNNLLNRIKSDEIEFNKKTFKEISIEIDYIDKVLSSNKGLLKSISTSITFYKVMKLHMEESSIRGIKEVNNKVNDEVFLRGVNE